MIHLSHLIEKAVIYRDIILENGFTYELSKMFYRIFASPLILLNVDFLSIDP